MPLLAELTMKIEAITVACNMMRMIAIGSAAFHIGSPRPFCLFLFMEISGLIFLRQNASLPLSATKKDISIINLYHIRQ